MRWNLAAVLLAAAVLAACDGEDTPVSGACDFGAWGACTEYPAGAPPGFSEGCAMQGGTRLAACPVEGRLGTCVFQVPAGPGGAPVTASETFYPGFLATPAEAAALCASLDGAFTAGTAQAGPATEQAFSCDERQGEGTCADYSGLFEPERRAAYEHLCTSGGGTLLAPGTTCPTEGRTGTCINYGGARVERVRHYVAATPEAAFCHPANWTAG